MFIRLLKQLLAYLPVRLPSSNSELVKFTKDVLELGGWEMNDANANSVALMILHLPMERSFIPKRYFYLTLRRSVSNQVAYAAMEDIKQRKNATPKDSDGQEASSEVVQEAKE